MLADIKVQLQIWKLIECFSTTRYRTFKEGIYISCKLVRFRRRLLSWLQRSFSDCIGKAIFRLKHSWSLMLNIHCVVWEKLSLTNTISFPSANSRILKTEIVKTTEMLKLIMLIRRCFLDSSTTFTEAEVPLIGWCWRACFTSDAVRISWPSEQYVRIDDLRGQRILSQMSFPLWGLEKS